ncbi:SLC13 family permease [Nakamurella sp.]|uniref:SLC13 family permease n=1 Tax=Nakamurella sp. TaxID=1869182 RepID=UPI00378322AC
MSAATVSLIILVGCIALFIWNRLPVGVVAILAGLSLYFTGVLDAAQVVAGFGDPVVIFIATLFVVSEGLESAGVTTWAGQVIVGRAGSKPKRLLAAVMLLAGGLSAAITPNGAAAALLPVTVSVARRARTMPSKMLIPMAFAASAGALLTLSGSPVNVIVSEGSQSVGGPGFGFFEFAIVGLPLLLGTGAFALLLGNRLLPARTSTELPADFGSYAATVAEHYDLNRTLHRVRVRPDSRLIGAQITELPMDAYPGLTLVGAQDSAGSAAGDDHTLADGDRLVLSGREDAVAAFAAEHGLKITGSALATRQGSSMLSRRSGIAEVVIPPRSRLIGQTLFPGMVRPGQLVVLAIQRVGKDAGLRPVIIAEGDALLYYGRWRSVESLSAGGDVLVVNSPESVRRQVVPLGRRAPQAIAVLVGMVILLATGLVPPAIAGLMAASAMILFKVVEPQQAYRAISWQTVVLIGGLIPLSTAIQTSGAADIIASALVGAVGGSGPYLLMLALFALTAALGQVISNAATVLIVMPIALSAAAETGVSPQAILMMVAVAGAASLLTPIATPANMIVMAPGGYRFGDYWKLGAVTMVFWLVIGVLFVPLVWPLYA